MTNARIRRLGGAAGVTLAGLCLTLASVAPASAAPARPQIANGEDAAPGAYPFSVKFTMTDIPRPDGTKYNSACSGALVAQQWVLTAGHCFHDVNRNPVSGPTPLPHHRHHRPDRPVRNRRARDRRGRGQAGTEHRHRAGQAGQAGHRYQADRAVQGDAQEG